MFQKTYNGKEVAREMTNSDLVMLNQFFYTLRDDLFTQEN